MTQPSIYGPTHKKKTIKEVDDRDGMLWSKCSLHWKVEVAHEIVNKYLLILIVEMQAGLLENARVPSLGNSLFGSQQELHEICKVPIG